MDPRAELLKTEIDQAKRDLARHLAELRVQAQATQRRAMSRGTQIAAALVAVYATYRLLRFVLRRTRS